MADYIIGSDNINGNERNYLNQIQEKLEALGHTVQSVGVGPNVTQSTMLSSASSGKIGLFLVGGLGDGGTFMDFYDGIGSYYHVSKAYILMNYEWSKSYLSHPYEWYKTEYKFRYIASGTSRSVNYKVSEWEGLSYDQWNKKYGDKVYCDIVRNLDEFIKAATGGQTSSEDEGGSSLSTYKDMIKDLIKVWDGDVEAYIIEDIMYVHKVPDPEPTLETDEETGEIIQEEIPEIYASEGVNIVGRDISITDYNPNTINTLVVSYTPEDSEEEQYYTITDDWLIKRFGEKLLEIPAVRYETIIETTETTTTTDTGTDDSTDSTGSDSTTTTTNDDTDTETDDSTDTTTTTTESTTTTKVTEIPITDPEEALDFAKREWHKIQRDNAHTMELKVFGYNDWRVGLWCKVYTPMFGEFIDMYIHTINHSHSSNEEWITSLQLTDYAPSLSSEEITATEDEEAEEEETEETSEDGEATT